MIIKNIYNYSSIKNYSKEEIIDLYEQKLNNFNKNPWISTNSKFKKPINSIFFEPGNPHAWGDPCFIYYNNYFHLFYIALSPNKPIYHLTSKNGIIWEKAKNIHLDKDLISFNTPNIHYFKSKDHFILEYTAVHPLFFSIRRIIKTKDFITWTKEKEFSIINIHSEKKQSDNKRRFEGNYTLIDVEAKKNRNTAKLIDGFYFGVSCGCNLQKSKDGINWQFIGTIKIIIPTPNHKQNDGKKDTITGFFYYKSHFYLICPSYRELMNYSRVYISDNIFGPYKQTKYNSILANYFGYYTRFGVGPNNTILSTSDFNEDLHLWNKNTNKLKHYVIPIFEKVVFKKKSIWIKYWEGNNSLLNKNIYTKINFKQSKKNITVIYNNLKFDKGLLLKGEIILDNDNFVEENLCLNSIVKATNTIKTKNNCKSFIASNILTNIDNRWVAEIKNNTELLIDLRSHKYIGRIKIQMGLNWTESEMDITFSNDNINWFKRPYTKSKLFSRLSNLYEFNKKVKTRFIKLNNFKNPRNLIGIQNIEIFNKTYENIGDQIQSPGLIIDLDDKKTSWLISFDSNKLLRMGYIYKNGNKFNPFIIKNLNDYQYDKILKIKLIIRNRFFYFYINNFSKSWLSLIKKPFKNISVINKLDNYNFKKFEVYHFH